MPTTARKKCIIMHSISGTVCLEPKYQNTLFPGYFLREQA